MRDTGLDSVRINSGAERCAAVFSAACRRGGRVAAGLLNGTRMFPTLFILMPQIERFRLHLYLGPPKRTAYAITDQILKSANSGLLSKKDNAEHESLKWILETGHNEFINGEYDEVLDVTSSVLIDLYEDKSVLPLVADLIFARGRAGRNIHDLAWAFFRSRDPETLKLIAQRMDSDADSELACSLLGVDPDVGAMAGGRRSGDFMRWFDENKDYLYFTDECFQLKSRPSVYGVDLERKYLQRLAQPGVREPVVPADSSEGKALAAFRQLNDREQSALSGYSQRLGGDKAGWRKWMALPIDEQIKEARQIRGDVWL